MTSPASGEKRRRDANRRGSRAEWIAVAVLVLRGYRILERHYLVKGGEIDIVARRGADVAFVEVKARPSLEEALVAVTPAKRRRVERAAGVWLARNPWAMACTLRGDLVAVAPGRWPRLVTNAFELRIG